MTTVMKFVRNGHIANICCSWKSNVKEFMTTFFSNSISCTDITKSFTKIISKTTCCTFIIIVTTHIYWVTSWDRNGKLTINTEDGCHQSLHIKMLIWMLIFPASLMYYYVSHIYMTIRTVIKIKSSNFLHDTP